MIYKAIANGDFSTLAIWQTWNGTAWINATVLPSLDDDVYSNNFIVEITTDVYVNTFNRSSVVSPSINQGGQFQITGSSVVETMGDVFGTNVAQVHLSPLSACIQRTANHTAKWTHFGDMNGGSLLYTYGGYNNSTSSIALVGNQTGGSASNAYGFLNSASSTFESIVGNQASGSSTGSYGFLNSASSTFKSIVGSQIGFGSTGFYNNASSTFESIVGNQTGGSGTNAFGFYNTGSSTIFSEIRGIQSGIPLLGFYNTGNLCEITFVGSEAYPQGI